MVFIGENPAGHGKSDQTQEKSGPEPQKDLTAANEAADVYEGKLADPSEDRKARVDTGLGSCVGDADKVKHDRICKALLIMIRRVTQGMLLTVVVDDRS